MENNNITNEIAVKYENIYLRAKIAAEKAGRNFDEIKIIAVSKLHPAKVIESASAAGLKCFGENYVQELTDKYDILSDKGFNDLEWHFIGHLQTNKVRNITPFVNYIHSVDSFKLAEEISKRAVLAERDINILIQMNTSGESSKSGCQPDDAVELISHLSTLENIKIKGLMTIGTFTDDEKIQREEFTVLRETLNDVNSQLSLNLKELSMGMTGDFETAIVEGATMVRIGTAIFGSRNYRNFR